MTKEQLKKFLQGLIKEIKEEKENLSEDVESLELEDISSSEAYTLGVVNTLQTIKNELVNYL